MLTKEGEEMAAWQAEKASFKATMQEYFDASSSNALDTAVDYDTEDSDYKWVQILRGEKQGINRIHHVKQIEKRRLEILLAK
jgi:hypothetical protein